MSNRFQDIVKPKQKYEDWGYYFWEYYSNIKLHLFHCNFSLYFRRHNEDMEKTHQSTTPYISKETKVK